MQTMRSFMLSCIWITTADQLHKFLRIHLMAVRANSILLRHRALGAAIDDPVSFFGNSAGTEPTLIEIMDSFFAWQVD
jgi:hypothetical protein